MNLKFIVVLFPVIAFFNLESLGVELQQVSRGVFSNQKSKFSLSYRASRLDLSDTEFAQTNRRTQGSVLPTSLTIDQHIFGLKYQHTPRWSFEVGTSYLKSKINLQGYVVIPRINRGPFLPPIPERKIDINIDSGSKGWSDSLVGVNYEWPLSSLQKLEFSTNLNLPTGNTNKEVNGRRLPYAGQLGSGTFDLIPKVAYEINWYGLFADSDLSYTWRTGRSEQNYQMGNQALLNLKTGYTYQKWISFYTQGRIRDWKSTIDPKYDTNSVVKDDPYVEAGRRWEVLAASQLAIPLPAYVGAFLIQGGLPIFQGQDSGPSQLESDWFVATQLVANL